ncbi:unnamed protein product [Vitrella brassicaformis CCMP3155]|uniref:PAP-associated domain-containing protein n=1 Tax=Vitrella brassicaformis (strain CCMP3155) TaxID=1169540 RepID=A0A0G4FT89_VITBC|nr:unnamed protein product [Vitrella brassicaformis CCMP3155]|eukprot:CEM17693.1 unnamed protein product [Vitrella brassicaformis CCMP3155]
MDDSDSDNEVSQQTKEARRELEGRRKFRRRLNPYAANGANLELPQLMYEFFSFYKEQFDFRKYVVAIRLAPDVVTKEEYLQRHRRQRKYINTDSASTSQRADDRETDYTDHPEDMWVEDPIETDRMYTVKPQMRARMMHEFDRTLKSLAAGQSIDEVIGHLPANPPRPGKLVREKFKMNSPTERGLILGRRGDTINQIINRRPM